MIRVKIQGRYFPILDEFIVDLQLDDSGYVFLSTVRYDSVYPSTRKVSLEKFTYKEFEELEKSFKSFLIANIYQGLFDFDIQLEGIRNYLEKQKEYDKMKEENPDMGKDSDE